MRSRMLCVLAIAGVTSCLCSFGAYGLGATEMTQASTPEPFAGTNLDFFYGTAAFDVFAKVYEIPNYGLRLEQRYGRESRVVPGLQLSLAASAFSVGNQFMVERGATFDIDVDPDEVATENRECNMRTELTGTLLGARADYGLRFWNLRVGLGYGMGLCFAYSRNDWDVDREDIAPDAFHADLERLDLIKPYFELGLRLAYCLGAHHELGIHGGLLILPISVQIGDPAAIEYGAYALHSMWQGGITWRVAF
jgi:hypothetical protein